MIMFEYIVFIILGLIIGSFLNVLIHRIPIMMKRDWHAQSCEILGQHHDSPQDKFNLMHPHSHCPHCHTPIKPWHNIPLFSFIMLKGRCASCAANITYRYPLVELLSAVIAALTLWRFDLTWTMALALLLGWGLLVASAIDMAEHFIPDTLTLPLLWLGLFANAFFVFITPSTAILGAVIGYLFFWCIAKLFYLIRKKEGLGHGDFKLLALFGAWFGIESLLNIVIISCFLGMLVSASLMLTKKINLNSQIPFGPFLALAGWGTMLFGNFIVNAIIK